MCLEAADHEGATAALTTAVRLVLERHRDGVWEWENGEHSFWMTYQGASVLRAWMFRMAVPTP
jgi:hypothetical protein